MSKKMTRSILWIITYTVLLVLILLKLDFFLGKGAQLLDAMLPFFIGFAIAFVLTRPCKFFARNYSRYLGEKAGNALGVVTAYAVVIAAVVALCSFVIPQVKDSVLLFMGRIEGYVGNLQGWIDAIVPYLNFEQLDISQLDDYIRKFLDGMLASATSAAGQVMSLTGSLFSMIVTGVLSLVFSVYMLSGREKLLSQCRRTLYAYAPKVWADRIYHVAKLSAQTFTNFVSGQLLEACILGGLCAAGMLFIQPDYAPLIGVLVGVSALVPVAGAYVGAVLSAFLLLMVSPVRALVFLVFLVILQQIEGNVIYPRVVGTSIGLPGIWVLLAVTVGGGLFGFLGIMLSVPVCSVLYTLLRLDINRRTAEWMPEPPAEETEES